MRGSEIMNNRLRLRVAPSPASNDHEVRIEIDGIDWLGSEYLGLDPPHMSSQLLDQTLDKLIVGRCRCGEVGCSSALVKLHRNENVIEWTEDVRGQKIRFDTTTYDEEVARFLSDYSWEDVGRRVERLVGELFAGAVTDTGLRFNWASTRIASRIVHLYFSKEGKQRIFEFDWDTETAESALHRARTFQREEGLYPSGG
jgi:hypothetical protein